jgi:hypothetical protein
LGTIGPDFSDVKQGQAYAAGSPKARSSDMLISKSGLDCQREQPITISHVLQLNSCGGSVFCFVCALQLAGAARAERRALPSAVSNMGLSLGFSFAMEDHLCPGGWKPPATSGKDA